MPHQDLGHIEKLESIRALKNSKALENLEALNDIAPLTQDELLDTFEKTGAIQHGHFVLTSGRHSDTYVQCARVMTSPRLTVALAEQVLKKVPRDVLEQIDCVVSPAVGGITFGFAVAYALNTSFIFAERKEGTMQLRRSFNIEPNQHILIAEDVVTTGGSVKEVEDVVRSAGGNVVGVVSLIDRKTDKKFSAPYWGLLDFPATSWDSADCALCAQGSAPESLGSRTLNSQVKAEL